MHRQWQSALSRSPATVDQACGIRRAASTSSMCGGSRYGRRGRRWSWRAAGRCGPRACGAGVWSGDRRCRWRSGCGDRLRRRRGAVAAPGGGDGTPVSARAGRLRTRHQPGGQTPRTSPRPTRSRSTIADGTLRRSPSPTPTASRQGRVRRRQAALDRHRGPRLRQDVHAHGGRRGRRRQASRADPARSPRSSPRTSRCRTCGPTSRTLLDGGTFGVGQPIVVWFDEPIKDKAAAERT